MRLWMIGTGTVAANAMIVAACLGYPGDVGRGLHLPGAREYAIDAPQAGRSPLTLTPEGVTETEVGRAPTISLRPAAVTADRPRPVAPAEAAQPARPPARARPAQPAAPAPAAPDRPEVTAPPVEPEPDYSLPEPEVPVVQAPEPEPEPEPEPTKKAKKPKKPHPREGEAPPSCATSPGS